MFNFLVLGFLQCKSVQIFFFFQQLKSVWFFFCVCVFCTVNVSDFCCCVFCIVNVFDFFVVCSATQKCLISCFPFSTSLYYVICLFSLRKLYFIFLSGVVLQIKLIFLELNIFTIKEPLRILCVQWETRKTLMKAFIYSINLKINHPYYLCFI